LHECVITPDHELALANSEKGLLKQKVGSILDHAGRQAVRLFMRDPEAVIAGNKE
jgi:hypothetical protein